MWNYFVFVGLLMMALFGGVLVLEIVNWKPVDAEDWAVRIGIVALFVALPLIFIWCNFLMA